MVREKPQQKPIEPKKKNIILRAFESLDSLLSGTPHIEQSLEETLSFDSEQENSDLEEIEEEWIE